MIKQTLYFTLPCSLSMKNSQLVISIKESEQKITRAIEDIGFIVIENQLVSITIPLLNELVQNNVSVIFCDNKMMPKSMLMNLDGNQIQGENYREQINISEPTKKQIWKQIVEYKIKNQSLLLDKICKSGNCLKPYYNNVKSGDTDNREGLAAHIYWKKLLGKNFTRDRNGQSPNNLLNYGYSLLRAATARALVGSGLSPAFGIFHRNRYNSFPLADDIMEPYRPFVDEMVFNIFTNGASELNKESKSNLLRILFCDVHLNKLTRPLEVALTLTTASLIKCFKGERKSIVYPLL